MNTIQESRMASSIFIGRWTPKILFSLKERPHRHGQLRRQLGTVSQRMLTRTLRNIENRTILITGENRGRTKAVTLYHLGGKRCVHSVWQPWD